MKLSIGVAGRVEAMAIIRAAKDWEGQVWPQTWSLGQWSFTSPGPTKEWKDEELFKMFVSRVTSTHVIAQQMTTSPIPQKLIGKDHPVSKKRKTLHQSTKSWHQKEMLRFTNEGLQITGVNNYDEII